MNGPSLDQGPRLDIDGVVIALPKMANGARTDSRAGELRGRTRSARRRLEVEDSRTFDDVHDVRQSRSCAGARGARYAKVLRDRMHGVRIQGDGRRFCVMPAGHRRCRS